MTFSPPRPSHEREVDAPAQHDAVPHHRLLDDPGGVAGVS
jgi:hypothetical protein